MTLFRSLHADYSAPAQLYRLLAELFRRPVLPRIFVIGHYRDSFGLHLREQLRTVGLPVEHQSETMRSEEHTSELQSQFHLVCRLLLEKKKKKKKHTYI